MSTPVEPPDLPADPMVTVLVGGRYRLLERIGSGGMGVVWLARDEVLRRRVAVKELHHGWGSSERTVAAGRERSLREARAAAALHHPNIVGVYDIVEHDGRPWIVMELVSGRSLKEMVGEDGPLPVERAVGIGLQLLSALQAAHAAGITHRDVKPANVLVDDGDRVRLTDFGLATMADAETLTETGVVLGTPGYLAPEQAKGLPPGPPADVFGLGATLYYAIEGVGPFHRDGYLPMLAAYARHDIRQPQRAGALAPAVLRLLTADPAKRPTAEQAQQMLLGPAVRRPGLTRRLVLTGGAAVTLAAAGVGLWSGRRHTAAGKKGPTRTPTAPWSRSQPSRQVGLGSAAWHRDDLENPVVVGSLLVGRHPDGAVLAVDLETGEQRWRGPRGTVSAIGKGLLLVNGSDGRNRVLDAATGVLRSRHQEGVGMGAEGLVFVDDQASELTALDAVTRRRRWRFRVDGDVSYAHTITRGYVTGPDGLLILAWFTQGADQPAWLYGIRRETGAVAWKTRMATAGTLRGPWGDAKRVYVGTDDREKWNLVAVDARTGSRRWTVALGEHGETGLERSSTVGEVAFVGKLAVAVVWDGQLARELSGLTAVEAGVIRWRRPLLNPTVAVASRERLFAASYDSVLHELDPATGNTLWSVATPGPVRTLNVGSNLLVATIGSGTTAYPLLRG